MSKTIGGNGHENWILLRLLHLLIGDVVPENEDAWCVVLELKDIVELLASFAFTEKSWCYLDAKISEHRKLLQNVEDKPKHHFLECYPHYSPQKHSIDFVCQISTYVDYLDVPNLFKSTVEVKGASNVSPYILAASVKQVIEKKFRSLATTAIYTYMEQNTPREFNLKVFNLQVIVNQKIHFH